MHIAISRSLERDIAKINPNITPQPDENLKITDIEILEAGKFIRNSILKPAQAKLLKMDFEFGSLHPNSLSNTWRTF